MSNINNFLSKTSEAYFAVQTVEVDNVSQECLSEFIHNPNILLLQGYLSEGIRLNYSTKIISEKRDSIIFYKTTSRELTDKDGIKNINIVTLSNAPAESLYQIIRQVYTPLLTETNSLINNKLQQNLIDLESNLRILAQGKGDATKFEVILTIEDELDYWKTIIQAKNISTKERETATVFKDLFEEINEEIRSIQTCSILELKEIAENISGLLDDVWRHNVSSYPQDRMKHIFDIIGYILTSKIQNELSILNLWEVNDDVKDHEVFSNVTESLKTMQTWISGCLTLTETYWPNHALHSWNGKPYVPILCSIFKNRVEEVLEIKTTHQQLNKLLTKEEKLNLKTDRMYEPFQSINIWSSGSKQIWESALAKFSSNLRPIEGKIAEKLKPRLRNSSTKQMLYEFTRYKILIQRPHVKAALNNELDIFVSSLGSLLKSIQSQLETLDSSGVDMYKPPEMSNVIQQVQWSKQMESKVKDVRDCAEIYLREFEGSAEVVTLAHQLLKELKSMYTQLHEDWSRDLLAQVKDGALRLSAGEPVVEFCASEAMVVRFSARAAAAAAGARAMAAAGLAPPRAAAAPLAELARRLPHARALQQVASFHNTLGERMIPSTRPMMLQAALNLSSLVQEQRAVYWDNIDQVANYSDKLKKAVFQLESQNTYLTNQHIAIRDIVESLMNTELLAKHSEWKKKVKDIRDIIEKVEANGYKNTELWRSHWDWQLYKALECQYIKTLLSLHKHFPQVRVELVLRDHEVRLQPPMEEIRVQHYNQLRRLVSLPAHFVGVQDNVANNDSIFTSIIHKHSWVGNEAVPAVEARLRAAAGARAAWARRAALAGVRGLDALCRERLRRAPPERFELEFKACKAYGQAVAKMTFEDEKIDWICIGTAGLRGEFEAQVRNLWSCLISSLQASCRDDVEQIDAFIANATLVLENKSLPKNTKELSEISSKQHALQEKLPEMDKLVEMLKKKGHMLHTWGGDSSIDGTIKEWQKVHEMMLSQQQIFEHHADLVKSSLNGEWENLNTSFETWASRWAQSRSRYEEMAGAAYSDVCDRCQRVFEAQQQWEKYRMDRDENLKECSKFGLEPKQSELWKQSESMMLDDVQLWTVFKEYSHEFQLLADQDWIVFNKKLHLIDEFVSNWSGCLEPYTSVTLYIQQELDKYNDLTPLLKYLRGTDFTESHWREIFSLLDIEYKKYDELQVKDLLAVAPNIKKHFKALQKICASATSEAAVRGALSELELWFAGARLTLTYYNDKMGNTISIVKDFKEILNKVDEQQWVVGSVRSGAGGGGAGAGGGGAGAGGACALWEERLRRAHALVRAAHHAQRRSVPYSSTTLSTGRKYT